jgi:hypothetical protein
MFLYVEPASRRVELREPADCKRFHVEAPGADPGTVRAALAEAQVGTVSEDGHAWIDPAAVRRLATGRVVAGWEDDFAAMIAYAGSKGWLDEAGRIRAHCVLE